MSELVLGKKLVIFLGAGGVGKTSCALAWAVHAALQGQRVALISVDPARRMAAALGIPLGHRLQRLPLEGCGSGTLEAAMLDSKAEFDRLVIQSCSPSEAGKILNNPIYLAVSSQLAGPTEYMALVKMHALMSSGQFDQVVVDTPPDSHAMDFLEKPNILGSFSESRVMSWLVKPFSVASRLGGERLVAGGEKLMGGLAEVTGLQALRMVSEFLVLIQGVVANFERVGRETLELLGNANTGYVLVSGPRRDAVRSAILLSDSLGRLGYRLDGLILNRCAADVLTQGLADEGEHRQQAASLAHRVQARQNEEAEMARVLQRKVPTPWFLALGEARNGLGDLDDFVDFARVFAV